MTQQEFETRTGVNVSTKEFDAIEVVYMASDIDKDEFCKMWRKMNASRVKAAHVEAIETAREQANRDFAFSIVNNSYTLEEMCQMADNFFTRFAKSYIETRLGISLQGTNANGIRYFKTVSEILFDLNKFLYNY